MNTQTAVKQNLTFSTKGLSKVEIKFLQEVEKMYFDGAKISFKDLMLPAFEACGFAKGSEESKLCLEAWNYWEFLPRPQYRESYKTPIKLSQLLDVSKPAETTVRNADYKTLPVNYIGKNLGMFDINGGVFFSIKNDCLWCDYNTIIGHRFVAVIENDLNFQ